MAVANFNYNNLIEHKGFAFRHSQFDVVPFKCLLAREIPDLNGLEIPQFIQAMDNLEFNKLSEENRQWKVVTDKHPVVSYQWLFSFIIGLLLAFTIILIPLALSMSEVSDTKRNKTLQDVQEKFNEIYDNRVLRLQQKVTAINNHLPNVQSEEDKNTMQIARDFFSLKHEFYKSKKLNTVYYQKRL